MSGAIYDPSVDVLDTSFAVSPITGSVFTVTGNIQLFSGSAPISQGNPLWVTGSLATVASGIQTITGSVAILNQTTNQGISGSIPWKVRDYESKTYSVLVTGAAIGNVKSMISILNASTTNFVRIKSVKIMNVQNAAVTGILADFRFLRMTGHSVGTQMVPQTFDTADTLDVGITVRTGATIAGVVNAPLLRYIWSSDEWVITTLDQESQNHSFQSTFPIYQHSPGTKPITLRANQGLTITQNTNSTVGTFDIEMIFTEENLL